MPSASHQANKSTAAPFLYLSVSLFVFWRETETHINMKLGVSLYGKKMKMKTIKSTFQVIDLKQNEGYELVRSSKKQPDEIKDWKPKYTSETYERM